MYETETKVLEISKNDISSKLEALGAKKILETRLTVDWYGPKGLSHNGDDPWYLRIRSNTNGEHEVTWKGKSDVLGVSRTHKEIRVNIENSLQLGDLLESIGLERYAHQEKDRVSWILNDIRFDLDAYPNMNPYLEIEGPNEAAIVQAIEMLGLTRNKTSSEGERALIHNEYKLNWFDMRF